MVCHVGCSGLLVSIILICVPSQGYFTGLSPLGFSCYNTHRQTSKFRQTLFIYFRASNQPDVAGRM